MHWMKVTYIIAVVVQKTANANRGLDNRTTAKKQDIEHSSNRLSSEVCTRKRYHIRTILVFRETLLVMKGLMQELNWQVIFSQT